MSIHEEHRLKLNSILSTICERVYFQPPENLKLKYPAIIYSRKRLDAKYADNVGYIVSTSFVVNVIYTDAQSDIPEKISKIPYSYHDRDYVSDNLYHSVFSITVR